MTSSNGYIQYKENSVYTAAPEDLTLMLYNGLVKFIMQAQMAIDEKSIERSNIAINKAQNIVLEFQNTLDMRYEVSQNLALLYDYMYRQLVKANIKKDKTILEEVLGFAKELREVWSQAMKIAKQQQPRDQQIAK